MKKKFKVNWDTIILGGANAVVNIAFIGLIGLVALGGVALGIDKVNEMNEESLAEEFEQAATQITLDETTYQLIGPNMILVSEDSVFTRYNFRDKTITVDGQHEADSVILFSGYDQASLTQTLNAACQITEEAQGLSDEYIKKTDGDNEFLNESIERAAIFARNNCKPG